MCVNEDIETLLKIIIYSVRHIASFQKLFSQVKNLQRSLFTLDVLKNRYGLICSKVQKNWGRVIYVQSNPGAIPKRPDKFGDISLMK